MNKILAYILVFCFATTPVLAGGKNRSFDNTETYNYNYNYKYKYDNGNNNEGWYAFGGLLGGLLLGQALSNPGPGVYAAPSPYAAPVSPQQYCATEWQRRWNEVYQAWEKIPYTVCWMQ